VPTCPDLTPDGSIVGSTGTLYRRTDRKLRRGECDDLIAAGVPIVTDPGYGGALEWWEGPEASARWAEISPLLFSGKTGNAREGWRAHLWASDDGPTLIHFEGWH
jgi:hypothetical protein